MKTGWGILFFFSFRSQCEKLATVQGRKGVRDRPSLESILVQANGTKKLWLFWERDWRINKLNETENNEEYKADSNQYKRRGSVHQRRKMFEYSILLRHVFESVYLIVGDGYLDYLWLCLLLRCPVEQIKRNIWMCHAAPPPTT